MQAACALGWRNAMDGAGASLIDGPSQGAGSSRAEAVALLGTPRSLGRSGSGLDRASAISAAIRHASLSARRESLMPPKPFQANRACWRKRVKRIGMYGAAAARFFYLLAWYCWYSRSAVRS